MTTKKISIGFHAVALGVLIAGHSAKLRVMLKLIAKEVKLYNSAGIQLEYSEQILRNITKKILAGKNDAEAYYLKITLYDDIVLESDYIEMENGDIKLCLDDGNLNDFETARFHFKLEPTIKIGQPHCCATMIHFGCVGDDLGGELTTVRITHDMLDTLYTWLHKLKEDGRFDGSTDLQMIGNCCS